MGFRWCSWQSWILAMPRMPPRRMGPVVVCTFASEVIACFTAGDDTRSRRGRSRVPLDSVVASGGSRPHEKSSNRVNLWKNGVCTRSSCGAPHERPRRQRVEPAVPRTIRGITAHPTESARRSLLSGYTRFLVVSAPRWVYLSLSYSALEPFEALVVHEDP